MSTVCYKKGEWDGKQSDLVLAETADGKKILAVCYEGTMDGSYFFEWIEVARSEQFEMIVFERITRWMVIPD